MQLASMWSISCNIQHLAHQQGKHKIQWWMLRKRTFRHFRRAHEANRRRYPHYNIITQIKARVAWRQKGPELWQNCADYNLHRSFWQSNDGKRSIYAMNNKRNGSRIMWIERPQWQESEFKTQRQQVCKCWNIWEMLKRYDGQPQNLKEHLRRCRMLSETVWAIFQVPKMRRIGKTRLIMKMIQSLAGWAKMINLAGWWAQSPKQYSTK